MYWEWLCSVCVYLSILIYAKKNYIFFLLQYFRTKNHNNFPVYFCVVVAIVIYLFKCMLSSRACIRFIFFTTIDTPNCIFFFYLVVNDTFLFVRLVLTTYNFQTKSMTVFNPKTSFVLFSFQFWFNRFLNTKMILTISFFLLLPFHFDITLNIWYIFHSYTRTTRIVRGKRTCNDDDKMISLLLTDVDFLLLEFIAWFFFRTPLVHVRSNNNKRCVNIKKEQLNSHAFTSFSFLSL